MVQAEFQAVVFAAGKGSRMPEITSGTPKCILPVGVKPMVWYPLQMLENAGFQEAILIVTESQKFEVQTALEKTDLNIKVDYFPIPTNEDLGTADSLRMLGDKIIFDVVCVSCDLITDVDLHEALNVFRKHNASVVNIFFNPQSSDGTVVPGPKAKHKPERDLVGIDSTTSRLVFLASASDFEENLTLNKSLLKKHTNITLYSNLIDAHLYVMKKWVCRYLQHEKSFSTIKGEFLPHIIKKQMSKPNKMVDDKTASIVNTEMKNDLFSFAKEDDLDLLIREASSFNDHFGDLKECYHGDVIRCFAYIAGKNRVGVRLNTIPSYWMVNSKIIELWEKITYGKEICLRDSKAEINSNQVDEKCIIWDSARLNEKTSFKSAIIGPASEVQTKTRIFNSVIMSNVVVKERCAIENCIVCDGAIIESGSQLKDCLVGSLHTVPENSSHVKEVLTDTDRLMEF